MKRKKIKRYGLVLEAPKIGDYNLGGFSKLSHKVLQANGSWLAYLPKDEIQVKSGVDSMSCVSFGLCNQVEILERRKFINGSDYSDRYIANASGTTETGNSPNKVYEVARTISGLIPEEKLSFSDDIKTFQEYHSPKPLNKKYYDEGRKWLNKYELQHEWVNPEAKDLIEALQYSPVGVAVYAWAVDGDKYHRPVRSRANHWTLLVGHKENDHWLVYDSYPDTDGDYIKKLAWDYKFECAKGIALNKIQKKSVWQIILEWLLNK